MGKTVLVTGGLGYIGSHTVVELLQAGFNVVIVDNLSNSEPFILSRIKDITQKSPTFIKTDLTVFEEIESVFKKYAFDAVIHFAALKSVTESVTNPTKYFFNNITSLVHVLMLMEKYQVKNIVFSSSATVYGQPENLPVTESSPFLKSLTAYGSTKQMGEEILEKSTATGLYKAISLRYFNPVGSHSSALIGELPRGVPNNLMPYITQTAIGKRNQLIIYGNDYNTPDGTCIRDFIHVVDLAKAHVKSLERLLNYNDNPPLEVFNLGTGQGYSVLELVTEFQNTTGVSLNYQFGNRREGDIECVYADVTKAKNDLRWQAELNLQDMIRSAWEWEKKIAEEKIN